MDRSLQKINVILAEIETKRFIHRDTAPRLVSLFREYIEANKLNDKYKTALFCGNWNVHPTLEKQPVPITLGKISDIMFDTGQVDYNDRINKELSLALLRKDFLAILAEHNIAPVVFDSFANWKVFLGIFLQSLLEKPLKLERPNKSVKYVAELVLKTLSQDEFARLDQQYTSELGIEQSTIFWAAKVMPKDVTVTGPLVLTESQDDFLHP